MMRQVERSQRPSLNRESRRRTSMTDNCTCTHCGDKRPAPGTAPFPNERDQRLAGKIGEPCGAGGRKTKQRTINPSGLSAPNPAVQIFSSTTSRDFFSAKFLNPLKSTRLKKEVSSGD